MEVIILGFGLVSFFVQLGLAVAVYDDAKRVDTTRQALRIGAFAWACVTLLGGVIAVGIYWVIYHSNLRPNRPEP